MDTVTTKDVFITLRTLIAMNEHLKQIDYKTDSSAQIAEEVIESASIVAQYLRYVLNTEAVEND